MSQVARDDLPLGRTVAIACICVCLGTVIPMAQAAHGAEPVHQRLFHSGEEGYPRYRIPSLIVTPRGALLAICEGRVDGGGLEGNVDLVLKQSEDDGRSWSPLRKIADADDDTLGNPCVVVDQQTGVIWLAHTRSPGQESELAITRGETAQSTRVYVTHSKDDGRNWSAPVEITSAVKRPGWTWYGTGPGVGIQLQSGRLLIPCYHAEGERGETKKSHVITSDDQGKSWQLGESAGTGNGECQALQRRDGSLYLSARTAAGGPLSRSIIASRDQGKSWSAKEYDKSLHDPHCEASLLALPATDSQKTPRWLYAHPAGPQRSNLTLRLSLDEGKHWTAAHLFRRGNGQYTSLALLPGQQVGCLYDCWEEDNYQLYFARIPLAELASGK